MNNFLHIPAIAVLLLFPYHTYSQDEDKKELDKCFRLEGGLIMGGQVMNDLFIYNPGGSLNASISLKASEKTSFGIGVGYSSMGDEAFVPVYFDFIGLARKKKNSFFASFQTGYSFGFSDKYRYYTDYTYRGGIFFGVGIGQKFQISEKTAAYLKFSYCHQFASVTYRLSPEKEFFQNLNYDMLVISFGIMLGQK